MPDRGFEGDKIKMERILNREIVIHAFRDRGSDKCLYIQISFNNEMHVIFTSSTCLIEAIKQVPADKFPFITTIIKTNDRFMFT